MKLLTVVAMPLAGIVIASAPVERADEAVPATAVPIARQMTGEECVLDCWTGVPSCMQQDYHYASWADPEGHTEVGAYKYSAGAHNEPLCWEGTCADEHGLCVDTFVFSDLEPLRLALHEERTRDVDVLLDHYGTEVVHANLERAALQIMGCDGLVVAHLPMSGEMLRALEAEEDE